MYRDKGEYERSVGLREGVDGLRESRTGVRSVARVVIELTRGFDCGVGGSADDGVGGVVGVRTGGSGVRGAIEGISGRV